MILSKIRNTLKKIFIYLPIPNKNIYCLFFNLYSLLAGSSSRIFYKDGFYYFKDRKWKFYHRKQGAYAYLKGLKKRGLELKSTYLINDLKFNSDDVIIDCGANNGDFYLCFCEKIEYIGIEPSPIVFSNLQFNVQGQLLINKGLWKSNEKEIDFYLSDEGGDSSIIPIKNYTKKITIGTVTLDDVIDQINKNIKLIKLEAEGSEPEILEGLKKNISKVEYISMDVGYERGINQESTLAPCVNYLSHNGFKIIEFKYSINRIVILLKNTKVNPKSKKIEVVPPHGFEPRTY